MITGRKQHKSILAGSTGIFLHSSNRMKLLNQIHAFSERHRCSCQQPVKASDRLKYAVDVLCSKRFRVIWVQGCTVCLQSKIPVFCPSFVNFSILIVFCYNMRTLKRYQRSWGSRGSCETCWPFLTSHISFPTGMFWI